MGESVHARFWEEKGLAQLSMTEWELLCDGCGQCCLRRAEDEDSGEIRTFSVACRYLDLASCRCTVYAVRTVVNPRCMALTPRRVKELSWLPATCAYRLLAEGRDLPAWHPLVSGNQDTVHEAGISVRDRAVSGAFVHPAELP